MRDNAVAMSFGYLERHSHTEEGVTVLDDLDLFEVSITAAPSNPDTRIIGMKSMDKATIQIASFEVS
jgi:HK97 family phage prohead protease